MSFNEILNKKCKSLLLAMTVVAICLLIALLAATTGKVSQVQDADSVQTEIPWYQTDHIVNT